MKYFRTFYSREVYNPSLRLKKLKTTARSIFTHRHWVEAVWPTGGDGSLVKNYFLTNFDLISILRQAGSTLSNKKAAFILLHSLTGQWRWLHCWWETLQQCLWSMSWYLSVCRSENIYMLRKKFNTCLSAGVRPWSAWRILICFTTVDFPLPPLRRSSWAGFDVFDVLRRVQDCLKKAQDDLSVFC